ncbi:MAG: M3 family metallopeptidase [Thermonemataceae bacterium]|nr:M3 family metallopeptidase [Thermonemataceae bacterium]
MKKNLLTLLLVNFTFVYLFAQNQKDMNNPLLAQWDTPHQTPPFDKIKNEHYVPALQFAIQEAKKEIEAIANNSEKPTFENTIVALENSGALVDRVSVILSNLNTAETSPELQKIAKETSPMLSEYANDVMLNEKLFQRIKNVYEAKNSLNLNTEQGMLLEKTYKRFARNGANLNASQKELLRSIDKKLSGLYLQFGENVLNDTNGFLLELQESDLQGLPDFVKEAAKETAKKKNKTGYVFTLQAPSYIAFMTYSARRDLRKKMFLAYGSRAFRDNANNNSQVMKDIVTLRHQRARLLGYATHAHFVLEERMAQNPQTVIKFLDELYQTAKPVAEKQIRDLEEYAKKQGFEGERLERWDYSFYAEKLKKEKFAIDDETLKPYFKLDNVMAGAFEVANKLFGLTFKEVKNIPVFHQEVKTYEVYDEKGNFLAILYTDFFPRDGKKGGAWMTSYREQKKLNGKDIRPHVSLTCNFTRPTENKPSLLTFSEVNTLFHEFGHCLHGILANGTYQSLSGTNVAWDFVEMPSQVLENWSYESEVLASFAKHYQTGEVIPQNLVQKIKDASNFMEGYATMRQLSFGMLDMAWHANFMDTIGGIEDFEKNAISKTDLFPVVSEKISTSSAFSHIFSGGYSAGYYSYKWSEVLDADAYELFKEKGIFNKEIANRFKEMLSKGGSEHPMILYKRFRGQDPSPKALLKRGGLL